MVNRGRLRTHPDRVDASFEMETPPGASSAPTLAWRFAVIESKGQGVVRPDSMPTLGRQVRRIADHTQKR